MHEVPAKINPVESRKSSTGSRPRVLNPKGDCKKNYLAYFLSSLFNEIMTKRIIAKEPKVILHKIAKEVPIKDITSPRIQRILHDMSDTLRASDDGVGIAAPQIGVSLRIFVASEEALALDKKNAGHSNSDPMSDSSDIKETIKEKEWRHVVFINPQILKTSRKKYDDSEGCLSVPHVFGTVPRAEKVKVAAYDEHGKKFERGASGLFARLLQHELDHLDGHLFLEKARETHRIEKEK